MCNCTSEVWSFGPSRNDEEVVPNHNYFQTRREIEKRQCQPNRFSSASSAVSAKRTHAEVADRAARIAGGLHKLGVKPGDSVCILMRNDVAFIEAAYAVMRLGAYAVPVNWHFKPDEVNYVLKDSGTSVLIGHADMLPPLRAAIPAGVTVLSAPTPPEILRSYKIDPDRL